MVREMGEAVLGWRTLQVWGGRPLSIETLAARCTLKFYKSKNMSSNDSDGSSINGSEKLAIWILPWTRHAPVGLIMVYACLAWLLSLSK